MALCNRCSSDFRISNLVPIDAMRGHYRLRHQFCQGSRLVDDMAPLLDHSCGRQALSGIARRTINRRSPRGRSVDDNGGDN